MRKYTDEKILAALLKFGSVRAAARFLRCAPQTISTRLADDEFRQKYDELKAGMLSETLDAMKARMTAAVDALAEIMEDSSNAATVRASAADTILRHGLRYLEAQELESRLSALEARYAGD